jgi:hypothetical protein
MKFSKAKTLAAIVLGLFAHSQVDQSSFLQAKAYSVPGQAVKTIMPAVQENTDGIFYGVYDYRTNKNFMIKHRLIYQMPIPAGYSIANWIENEYWDSDVPFSYGLALDVARSVNPKVFDPLNLKAGQVANFIDIDDDKRIMGLDVTKYARQVTLKEIEEVHSIK